MTGINAINFKMTDIQACIELNPMASVAMDISAGPDAGVMRLTGQCVEVVTSSGVTGKTPISGYPPIMVGEQLLKQLSMHEDCQSSKENSKPRFAPYLVD